ncbi:hypothetical protein BCR44DRAFT_64837 [Catenaria anguillulae PL171]|uniref:Peptide hydrolase n=1 Tax=Catenaria anguillulae PL171 TaxID=765915 RepID=A0A1Y2I1N0_9FUNG|nr:hypothetical protein BCR44DRAFT_64837 [Catenaria anguillulae PL171]
MRLSLLATLTFALLCNAAPSAPTTPAILGHYGVGDDAITLIAPTASNVQVLPGLTTKVPSGVSRSLAAESASGARPIQASSNLIVITYEARDGAPANARSDWYKTLTDRLPKGAQVQSASPNKSAVIVSVPNEATADILSDLVPGNSRLYRVDPSPKPGLAEGLKTTEVSRLDQVAAALAPGDKDPAIESLIAKVDIPFLQSTVRYLSGEDPASGLTTRHAQSEGYRKAANWVKTRFEEFGCATVELVPFRTGYGPNVVCTIPGADLANEHVLLTAHLDSRGTRFTASGKAPGADDDGSGSAMLLASLRAIKQSNLRLRRTLKVVAFGGEEQGLYGSAAYARAAKSRRDNIKFVLQGDMLAYRKPGEPLQLALPPASRATPAASEVVRKIAAAYVPELTVGTTNACCSDQQSFVEQGFPATALFERNGGIADPQYHKEGDVSARTGYDWQQLQGHTKVAVASVVSVAEIVAAPAK